MCFHCMKEAGRKMQSKTNLFSFVKKMALLVNFAFELQTTLISEQFLMPNTVFEL